MTRIRIGAATLAAVLGVAGAASADFVVERRLALAPGGTFMLDSDVGTVVVTGDSTSGALVRITARHDDFDSRYEVQFADGPDGVTVRVKRRGSRLSDLWRGWRSDNARFTIRLPPSTSATISTAGGSIQASRLGNVRLRTSGGSIRAESLDGRADLITSGGSIAAQHVRGDVDADTSGGGIRIADVRGRVRADTSGGSIDIDTAGGDVRASTSGGGVRVRAAGGRVEAHTSGGSINVTFVPGNAGGGDLSTSGGGITVTLDPTVALSIDASSSGGRVHADVPVTIRGSISRQALSGELNGGGALLRMRTSGGGVRIASR